MKVAIIASGFLPVVDGVTVSGLERLQKLSEWGYEVLFFCPDYSPLSHVYPNWKDYIGNLFPGVRVVPLKSNGLMGLGFDRNVDFSAYRSLLKELNNFQPDLIHVDEPDRLFLGFLRRPGIDYAKKANIPCVGFYRTNFIDYIDDFFPLYPALNSVIKFLFHQLLLYIYDAYDMTLVSSQVTHKKLMQMGFRNCVYANLLGFDQRKFSPNLRADHFFEQTYRISDMETKVKLVFLGRLTPDKNWDFTLNSLNLLKEKIDLKDVAVIVVGDGPLRDEIKTRLQHITPHAHLLGRIPPEAVPGVLANCDIHITTSEKETRGLTVLEAFASGIPVIAPQKGGVMENIQSGWNGFLFAPQQISDFVQNLEALILDAELRQTMGHHATETVAAYSWDVTVKNLVQIWAQQISARQLAG